MLGSTIPVPEIEKNLTEHVHPLVATHFEIFGETGLSIDQVEPGVGLPVTMLRHSDGKMRAADPVLP